MLAVRTRRHDLLTGVSHCAASLAGKVYFRRLAWRPFSNSSRRFWRNQCTVDQLFTLLGLPREFAHPVHVFRGLKKDKKAYSFVRPWSFKDEWCRTTGYRGRCYVPFSSWLSKVGALSLFTAQSQTHSQWVLELQQGCPLSPSLFLTFMDRISRHRQREERESSLRSVLYFYFCT